MAVRYAYSLGLHREEALVIYPPLERHVRRQVWRSLYCVDRFLSLSLGRPTAIVEEDCSGNALHPPIGSPRLSRGPYDEIMEARVRACRFMTLAREKVYKPRKVSTKVAKELGELCKEWPKSLPPSLHWQRATPGDRRQAIAILHVNVLYCYSVTLFTRPFFTYLLCKEMQHTYQGSDTASQQARPRIETYSEACIIASLHTIALIKKAYDGGYLPRQNPFCIFAFFSAALIVLSGQLTPRTTHAASNKFVEDAVMIMSYCGESDPQACKMLKVYLDLRAVIVAQDSGKLRPLTPVAQSDGVLPPDTSYSRQPPLSIERETSSKNFSNDAVPQFNQPVSHELRTSMEPLLPMATTGPELNLNPMNMASADTSFPSDPALFDESPLSVYSIWTTTYFRPPQKILYRAQRSNLTSTVCGNGLEVRYHP